MTFAQLSPTDFTREATISAFSAYARKSPDAARADLNSVARAQKMNDSERQQLKDAVAWQYMGSDVTDEQAARRDGVIQETDSVTLRERRVRLALSNADDRDLDRWLTRYRRMLSRKRNGSTGAPYCWKKAAIKRQQMPFWKNHSGSRVLSDGGGTASG